MHFFTFLEVMTMGLVCFVNVAHSNSLGAVKEVANPQSIRIVGGDQATPHQFPWQVGIFMDGAYFCGGSIISDEYILTAAHCADGFRSYEVVIGAHEVRNPSEEINIPHHQSTPFVHPDWVTLDGGDTTIVKVPGKIEFNEYVPINGGYYGSNEAGMTMLNVQQSDSSAKNYASFASFASLAKLPSGSGPSTTLKPGKMNKSTPKRATTKAPAACTCPTTLKPTKTTNKSTVNNKPIGTAKAAAVCKCPTTKKPSVVIVNNGLKTKKPAGLRAFSSYAHQMAIASEWGIKTTQDGQISPIFMATNVTILDNEICAQLYPGQFNGDFQLCASSPDKNICQNNSNGQIYVNDFVLVGITTLKNNCTEPKNTRVYARISPYVNSIQSIIANNSAPATSG